MTSETYSPPVNVLLQLGEKRLRLHHKWIDYPQEYGFTKADIPELTRMAIDQELNWAESDKPESWAPVHAWRALGQLKAEDAIEPLLSVFSDMEGNDWFNEEMPEVFSLIGPAALSPTRDFLENPKNPLYCRWTAASILVKLGQTHPELRAACVAALEAPLERYSSNNPEMNGVLVNSLLDLEAKESAPIIEQAYAAKWVDFAICGDWLDVQRHLGLLSPTEVYERRHQVDADRLRVKTSKLPASPSKGFGAETAQKKPKKKSK
ncbi:PBS lyase [Thermoleptolyngbya sichuanensis A183]|uniref:PBS lyase n=1 Tax=Thermoleptolyngbya sichuanensis A183 TaxID=2737172 RepID=A0A6M8BM82_9CYAN|nr:MULTISPECIES: PBS lyase [Thermoleptolyngbya]QKD83405.1 PBS lyase [Thermoleptolyngbya sichuanensis A183]